jgi:hypothetical protein
MARRSGVVDATASNGSINVARISVATSGTDFTAPKADFAVGYPDCLLLSWEITFVTWERQELEQRLVRCRRASDHRHDAGGRQLELDPLGDV